MSQPEVRALIAQLIDQQFTVELGGGGHYKIRGADGAFIATLPQTPSDHRALLNQLRHLKRAGFDPGLKAGAARKARRRHANGRGSQ